ncbi:MAG: glutathione S-transferase family protein [Myxococcota bacterium]
MPVTVFDHPLSPYAQKVKIALREKGVDFEARLPDAIGSGTATGEFASASPRGEVPALVDADGTRVFDSSVILEYIEDRWPDPPLLPPAPADRARVRMLEDVMDTHFEAITWGLAEIRYFGRATGSLAAQMEQTAGKQLEGWFGWLRDQLADRDWFNGDRFGWGDLGVVPFLNGAAGFGHTPGGSLGAWLARANARASVAECARAAAAAAFEDSGSGLEQVRAALEQGLFKREYRDHRLEWMVKTGGLEVVSEGLRKSNIRFIEPF